MIWVGNFVALNFPGWLLGLGSRLLDFIVTPERIKRETTFAMHREWNSESLTLARKIGDKVVKDYPGKNLQLPPFDYLCPRVFLAPALAGRYGFPASGAIIGVGGRIRQGAGAFAGGAGDGFAAVIGVEVTKRDEAYALAFLARNC
jgi:hypothetical protein